MIISTCLSLTATGPNLCRRCSDLDQYAPPVCFHLLVGVTIQIPVIVCRKMIMLLLYPKFVCCNSVSVLICQTDQETKRAFEPPRDKTNKMACAPSEDSDQPGHPPSLIRVSAVRMKKACVLNYPLSTQGRLWSGWADAQADLSLHWVHTHFVGFVMLWLI